MRLVLPFREQPLALSGYPVCFGTGGEGVLETSKRELDMQHTASALPIRYMPANESPSVLISVDD
jgi:hypothetical protein